MSRPRRIRRALPVLGARDGWALGSLSAGAALASPWFAGVLSTGTLGARAALTAGAGAALAGGMAFAWPRLARRFDPVDERDGEGFVLPSDPPLEDTAGDGGNQDSLLIGHTTDSGTPVRIPYNVLTRHLALIGASGFGKTSLDYLLMWQHLVRGGGFTMIDAKIEQDNLADIQRMMHAAGRLDDLYVLDISNPEISHTYNPLLNGDPDEIASRLLNLIPASEDNPGADHYRQSANHALTAFAGAAAAAKRLYHFGDLTILLQSPAAMKALLNMTPEGPEKMALDVFLDKYRRYNRDTGAVEVDATRLKDTLGGIAGRLALFAQGKFGRIFNTYTPAIDLFDIITQNKVLYVRLPTMAKETAALNFAKMLLSDYRSAAARVQALPRAQRPDPPHLLFPDEMGSYVTNSIARFFEQVRSANIGVIPGFQALGNLREVSPEFADILMQNTLCKVMFRFGGSDSATQAAELIGTQQRFGYSLSTSTNESRSAPYIRATPQSSDSATGGTSESWQQDETWRVAPAKLAALSVGECVLMIGARVYHLRVPLLGTAGGIVPDETVRFHRDLPPGWRGLRFDADYTRFVNSS